MNDTTGMAPEDVAMLINIAHDWAHEWVVIRADPPNVSGNVWIYAYDRKAVFHKRHNQWGEAQATYLTKGVWDIDPKTFRIDNPAKR